MGVYLLLSNDYIQILDTMYHSICIVSSRQDRNISAVVLRKNLSKNLKKINRAIALQKEVRAKRSPGPLSSKQNFKTILKK